MPLIFAPEVSEVGDTEKEGTLILETMPALIVSEKKRELYKVWTDVLET